MAIQIQLRQGTTTEHSTFTGAVGEVTVDTTKDVVVVHDGVTVGGHPVAARANADGSIELIKKDGTSAGTINSLGLFNNTLTSTNINQALTAAQGKLLKDTINNIVASSYAVGQTYTDVTSSRFVDTNYLNSSAKPITLYVTSTSYGSDFVVISVNGLPVNSTQTSTSYAGKASICAVVLPGQTYIVSGRVSRWVELN